ncbi:GTPase/DUF3482 domain-containing protein [Roseateles oligotrophus]|uniref:GTPase/DUF3482 domain-containing protein n=1 Tax=Roseateles oligotrophus TaxID=1769250 RepID=A0ABT2YMN6_9BURK|nr:GTPase/DUF3482 domain-containing protein [Roseateles oligotrophus]MCV2371140.1 GTPase/DUF3482 domain-containing protein [Roseateles oligotrophus]
MAKPIALALVGHTNAGKTSLLRTLTRRSDFGEVSNRPGTTRQVEALGLRIDGRDALRFLDTPGLEDAPALLDYLQHLEAGLSRQQRLQAFLGGPAAKDEFEQEAKVLRCLLEVDAALLVIDARESPLPKFASEIEVLMLCARPLMPVLNFVSHPQAQEPAWRRLLAGHGLHAYVRFDAVAPFVGAEQHLYADLGALLPERREALSRVAEYLKNEALSRRAAGLRLLSELLLNLAAFRMQLAKASLANPVQRADSIRAFQSEVAERSRRLMEELLALHGFDPGSAEVADLPALAGRWESDLFNPEALKSAGKRLGAGAAIGGAIGLGLDVALAGLSLGVAASLGAALGGVASQGFGAMGRQLSNKLRGIVELSLENRALLLLAAQHLTLLLALERRGHAALEVLQVKPDLSFTEAQAARLQASLGVARAHPDWAGKAPLAGGEAARRHQQGVALSEVLAEILAGSNLPGTKGKA